MAILSDLVGNLNWIEIIVWCKGKLVRLKPTLIWNRVNFVTGIETFPVNYKSAIKGNSLQDLCCPSVVNYTLHLHERCIAAVSRLFNEAITNCELIETDFLNQKMSLFIVPNMNKGIIKGEV